MLANLNTHSSRRSTRPAPPSSHLRVPHVFVIPPEEEQKENPPWCCFDADQPSENSGNPPSSPDIRFLDVPYLFQPSGHDAGPPTTSRTSVRQQKLRHLPAKKLEKKQRPEAVKIIENKPSQARQKDVPEDSDVIEVVKVKRTRGALADLEENIKTKRSKTLKARASSALQSIKNVGKGSHRTHVKELWTSSEGTPGIFKGVQEQIRSQLDQAERRPSPKKESLSRANSRSLSQIFQPAKLSRCESTSATRTRIPMTLAETHHDHASVTEIPDSDIPNDMLNKPVSSNTLPKRNTKFSVRELHRLFTFSSSGDDDDPLSVSPTTMAPFSSARDAAIPSASTCTLSSDYPDAPMDQDMCTGTHFLDVEIAERKLASRSRGTPHTHREHFSDSHRLSDFSFEMRLDSLHFDALSFDAEDFDVSMDGNLLR